MALACGMKTRIDFFCRTKSDAAYDVVNELLKLGYKVVAFPPENKVIEQWFLIELDANKTPTIKEIEDNPKTA